MMSRHHSCLLSAIGLRPWRSTNAAGGSRPVSTGSSAGDHEWAYDRKSSIGRLDKALDAAQAKDWTVVDMKRDCKGVVEPMDEIG